MIKVILFQLLVFCLVSQSDPKTNDWKVSATKDNITAYTRKVEDSKYLEYKIETQIFTSVDEVLKLLMDTKHYKEIFPYLSEVELLRNELPRSYDVLVVIKTPFPVRNRIGVYTNDIKRIDHNHTTIQISQNTNLIPDSKHVKIEECYGSWSIKQITEKQVFISHTFFADPGGSIPAWIINAFALKQPMKTFSIIREKLESKSE